MTTETSRARVARLHGEAARRVLIRALGDGCALAAVAFAVAVEKQATASMPAELVALLNLLDDEEIVAKVRPYIEPDIRRRLAEAGRLPS